MAKQKLCGRTITDKITLPVKIPNFGSPIIIDSNDNATISMKANIVDKGLRLKINQPGESIVINHNFYDWNGCIPVSWEGDWMCNPGDEFLYKQSLPQFHRYIIGESVARSIGPIKVKSGSGNATMGWTNPDDNLPTYAINTTFFDVNGGSEYSIDISFIARNGIVKYPTRDILYTSPSLPIALSNDLTIQSPISNIPLNVSSSDNSFSSFSGAGNSEKLTSDKLIITVEPAYGAFIDWYNGSSKIGNSVLIGAKRGQTSDDIYWWEENAKLTNKEMKVSLTAPVNATRAKIYIWNHTNEIPSGFTSISNPFIICSHINVMDINKQFKFITNIEKTVYPNGEGIEENIDSISYMDINSPKLDTIEEFLLWDSSSLKGGYYDVTSKSGEISSFGVKDLKFGNENKDTIWQSWIPFTPDFTNMNKDAKIESVKLIVTASSSQPYTPGKMCAISAGFEDKKSNVTQPTTNEVLKAKTAIKPVNNIITESWVAGEEYEIDITNSAKALFGNDVLSWMTYTEWYTVAVILRDNSSGEGTHRTIAGIGNNDYSEPKLKITYSEQEYLENSYVTPIKNKKDTDFSNTSFYNRQSFRIGGTVKTESNSIDTDCERALIYFNLSSIPSNETVTEAKITLRQSATSITTGTTSIAISDTMEYWGWKGSTWNKAFGVKFVVPHGHWTNNTINKVYATYNNMPKPTGDTARDFTFNADGRQKLNDIISGQSINKGFLIREINDRGPTMGKFAGFLSPTHSNIAGRPSITITTNVKTYVIQNKIDYDNAPPTDPDVPIPPPTPKKIVLNKTQGLNYTYGTTQLLYKLKGAKNTQRYLTVSESWLYESQQGVREPYILSLSFNGQPMTELIKAGGTGNYSNSRIWGLAIPDEWEGGETVEYALTIIRSARHSIWAVVRELSNVNKTTPVKSKASAGYTSVNPGKLTMNIPVVPGGYAIDALSSTGLYGVDPNKKSLTPSINQTLDGKPDNIRFFSHYKSGSIPDTPSNVALEWSIPKDAGRNVGVAVSFNPV